MVKRVISCHFIRILGGSILKAAFCNFRIIKYESSSFSTYKIIIFGKSEDINLIFFKLGKIVNFKLSQRCGPCAILKWAQLVNDKLPLLARRRMSTGTTDMKLIYSESVDCQLYWRNYLYYYHDWFLRYLDLIKIYKFPCN